MQFHSFGSIYIPRQIKQVNAENAALLDKKMASTNASDDKLGMFRQQVLDSISIHYETLT